MSTNNLALYVTSRHLPRHIHEDYSRSDFKLIEVIPSHHVSSYLYNKETSTVHVNPYQNSCSQLVAFLSQHIDIDIILLRQYLEAGAFLFSDIPKSVTHLLILGDTHHLPGQLYAACRYLSQTTPNVVSSYANPGDALLIRKLINQPSIRFTVYPPSLVACNTLGGSLVHPPGQPNNEKPYGLCATLTPFQKPRELLLRTVLKSTTLLSRLELFEFQPDIASFTRILRSLCSLVVPTNGSQISPQLSAACLLGLKPISDCYFQLSLHPAYSPLLTSYVHIHELNSWWRRPSFTQPCAPDTFSWPSASEHIGEVDLTFKTLNDYLTLDDHLFETPRNSVPATSNNLFQWFDYIISQRSSSNPLNLHQSSIATHHLTSFERDFLRIRGMLYDF